MAAQSKKSGFDLRKYHTIFTEIGLILALLIFIIAMRAELPGSKNVVNLSTEKEVVTIKHVPVTKHRTKPVAPQDPVVPAQAPNNDPVIGDPIIERLDLAPSTRHVDISPPPRDDPKDKEDIFMVVEHEPKLIGGLKELQKKVNYPARCQRANIEGRVTLQFVVNKKGHVENITVLSGIGGGCDEAAVKAVKEHAKFKPGLQRGEPVNVRYSLPIFFRLK